MTKRALLERAFSFEPPSADMIMKLPLGLNVMDGLRAGHAFNGLLWSLEAQTDVLVPSKSSLPWSFESCLLEAAYVSNFQPLSLMA